MSENLRLLVIDDRQELLNEMREWLVETFKYPEFDTALSIDEAKVCLQTQHYDVIIADMYVGKTIKTGGFLILKEVEDQEITSIVIIFTANDNYADCRQAFLSGAFDYISKNKAGNAFEELHHSIQRALTYIDRWGNRHNEEWIQNNCEYLNTHFNNQYVAVLNNSVIESAETQEELKQRIKEKNLPLTLATIRKITVKLLHDLPIEQLLATVDEGHHLEFKSSLLYNLHTQQRDEAKVLHAVLKTIIAFLNAEGGTLVIGVQDDKGICGIANDLALIPKKQTEDGFELHLRSYIEGRIGKDFCVQNIKIRFETIAEQRVCIVDVTRSTKRAFLEGKEFFVRNGNGTASYTISQFYEYLQSSKS